VYEMGDRDEESTRKAGMIKKPKEKKKFFFSPKFSGFLMKALPHIPYDPEDMRIHSIAIPGVLLFMFCWLVVFVVVFVTGKFIQSLK
jgi:hypothetical protein